MEAQPGGRLEHAGAQGIGQHDASGAHGAQQPRHAQGRIAAQLQRIAEVIVQASQDGVHPLQSRERLQVHRVVAHREVRALRERHAQLPCQVGMFKIGLVERTRRQHHGQRALPRIDVFQQLHAQGCEEAAQFSDVQVADRVGQHLLDDLAILQRIAGAGRGLSAIGQHPPAAIRRARQIHRVDVQPGASRGHHAMRRPEEIGMTEGQFGRHHAFGNQPLRTIQIGEQGIQHARALRHALFDLAPLRGTDHQRQRVQGPGAVGALGVGVHIVGDAVLG